MMNFTCGFNGCTYDWDHPGGHEFTAMNPKPIIKKPEHTIMVPTIPVPITTKTSKHIASKLLEYDQNTPVYVYFGKDEFGNPKYMPVSSDPWVVDIPNIGKVIVL